VSGSRTFRLPLDGVLVGERGGSGPPLLLIHGWALDRRMWAPQRRAFRRHFATISYGRRGFGATTCIAGLDQELNDIDTVLQSLASGPVAILGMSQGARVALRYALTRPAAVSALILHGAPFEPTPPPAGDPAHLPLREYAALLASGRFAEVRGAIAAHPLMQVPRDKARIRASIRRMIDGYRGEDLAAGAQVDGTAAFSVTPAQLGSITVPTLVLTGDAEVPWLIAAADRLATALPHAARALVPGGGPLVNISAPRAYNRTVIRWLTAFP